MCGRCKCCNSVMEDWEMSMIDPLSGTYSELCSYCLSDNDLLDDDNIDLEFISEDDIL